MVYMKALLLVVLTFTAGASDSDEKEDLPDFHIFAAQINGVVKQIRKNPKKALEVTNQVGVTTEQGIAKLVFADILSGKDQGALTRPGTPGYKDCLDCQQFWESEDGKERLWQEVNTAGYTGRLKPADVRRMNLLPADMTKTSQSVEALAEDPVGRAEALAKAEKYAEQQKADAEAAEKASLLQKTAKAEEPEPAAIALAADKVTNMASGGTDVKEGRVRTLAAAKQLLKLMNVAAMAEERANELLEEARKADAEADLVRMPIRDVTDKKSRYQRVKTLQNAETLNIQAAQAVIKARKLMGMVQELKSSAKVKTA